jgi:hypothetical protein
VLQDRKPWADLAIGEVTARAQLTERDARQDDVPCKTTFLAR